MAQDLGSVMGNAFAGASSETAVAGKKKLRKVGDHWEDENGVKYADAEGNVALKMEGPDEVKATNVGGLKSFFDQIKNDPQAKGNLFTGEVGKKDLSTGSPKPEDQGPADEEADKLYSENEDYLMNTMGLSKAEWRKKWASWNESARQKTRKMLAQGQANQA